MSVKIKLKHSSIQDRAPQPADLTDGELALNVNENSPAAYIKDSAGNIVKLAGVGSIATPDASETVKGVVELATAAETTTGTDDTRAVHPAGLKVELDKKANLAGPTFTGVPKAPTAAAGTSTTQIATTSFVGAAVTAAIPDASENVKGIVELATAAETTAGTDDTRAVHPAGLKVELDKKANLASPTFTGVPEAPTAAAATNNTQIATTAFVYTRTPNASQTVRGLVELATAGETTTGTSTNRAVHPAGLKVELDKKANLAGPTFTGIPEAPTATAGTNTTQIATTAFVGAAVTAAIPDASETVKGIVELATAAETTTGTDNTRAVHPAGLKVELDKKVAKAGDTMTGDLLFNDGTSDVVDVDVSAGTVTATDGTESVVISKDGTVVATGDVQAATVVATGNVQMASLNGGPLAGFRNQIINGDFSVWQRGEDISLGSAANNYAADRWVSNGDTRWTKNNGNSIPGGALGLCRLRALAAGQTILLRQGIELPGTASAPTGNTGPFVEDSQWTLSWYAKFNTGDPANLGWGLSWRNSNTLTAGTGLIQASAVKTSTGIQELEPANAAGYARYGVTVTIDAAAIPGSATCLCLAISLTEAGSADWFISGIQFELGPVATPFEHRPIGTEIALCQRFYQLINFGGAIFNGNSSSSVATAVMSIYVEPRTTTPTITSQTGSATLYHSGGRFEGNPANNTASAIVSGNIDACRAAIRIARLASTATFNPQTVGGGASESTFGFDMEL